MMQAIGWMIAFLARMIVKKEWLTLVSRLRALDAKCAAEPRYYPSDRLVCLLLTAEDRRFFRHRGVDPLATAAAVWALVTGGPRRGGSTIEQQLVRVLTGRFERTLRRKVRELMLATLVSTAAAKERIPALYLRVAYFGWRMNGIAEAYRRLGLCPSGTTEEAEAVLVSLLKYPLPKNPSQAHWRRIQRRVEYLFDASRGRLGFPAFMPTGRIIDEAFFNA